MTFDKEAIERYVSKMRDDPHHRYWSWDHCFQAFSSDVPERETHALHLGFYLASWGMYRGSAGLLQKNYKIHHNAVDLLFDKKYGRLKCSIHHEISAASIDIILKFKEELSKCYKVSYVRGGIEKKLSNTDTLLSKVMLGTLGCVPAYDQYFIQGLEQSGFSNLKFTAASLKDLFDYAEQHKDEIQDTQIFIKDQIGRDYPLMKVLDMHFWQLGYDAALVLKSQALSKKI